MNKKKLFGALASAAMLLNGAPLNVFAEEMVETGPSGTLTGVDSSNVALNSTNFPDDNLLTAIKNQNPTATTADGVKTLMVQGSAVKSLEGLQYLTELQSFALIDNDNISALDLSNNTKLNGSTATFSNGLQATPFYIVGNGALTSITLPEDEDLKALTIMSNAGLDEINLAPCALLEDATLSGNSLDTLNLSGNVYLQNLYVSDNDLYQLDATPCKQLNNLDVSFNKIYELKVPTAIPNALKNLDAESNKLQTFDGSGLKGLTNLNLSWNMLNSVVLPSGPFQELQLQNNHLAALNLKKINFAENATVEITPQYLYANVTDKAVNIKDYDANFNPDQAKLPNDKDFSDDSIFNIPEVPGEASKAEFTNNNTEVVVTVNPDGTMSVEVLLNGVPVNASNYVLTPDLTSLSGDEIKALKSVTVTGKGNCVGEAVVTPVIKDGIIPPVTGTYQMTKENTVVTYEKNTEVAAITEASALPSFTAQDLKVVYEPSAREGEFQVAGLLVKGSNGWKGVEIATASDITLDPSTITENTTSFTKVDITGTTLLTAIEAAVTGEYNNLSATTAIHFESVAAVAAIPLTATNARFLGSVTGGAYGAEALQVDEDGSWNEIANSRAISNLFNTLTFTQSTTGNGTEYIAQTVAWKSTATAAQKASILPYTLAKGTATNIPGKTWEDVATPMTLDNTRVIYVLDGTQNVLRVYVQEKNSDGEWITLEQINSATAAAPTDPVVPTDDTKNIFDIQSIDVAKGVVPELILNSKNTTAANELAQKGYSLAAGLKNVTAFHPVNLSNTNTKLYYKLGQDGKPIYTKVEVNFGTEEKPDWQVISTDPTALFTFGTFDAPTAEGRPGYVNGFGALDPNDASKLPPEYRFAPANSTLDDVPAYPEDTTPPISNKTNIGDTTQVVSVELSIDGDGTLTITPAGEGTTPVQITGDDILAGFDITKDGETTPITSLDQLAAGDKVTITAKAENEKYEGTASNVEVTNTPITPPVEKDEFTITSITIKQDDGTTVEVPNPNEYFQLTDVDTTNNTGTLSYRENTPQQIKDTYVIENGTLADVPATEEASEGEPQVEMMSEYAPANASTSYYIYSTLVQDDVPNAVSMRVWIQKEDLMNRLYNPNSGEHFYTKDTHERDVLVSLGWQSEGIGWVAPTAAQSSIPVYRLYNPNAGDHHYTKDPNEKDTLVRAGWNYEGIGWYSAYDGTYGTDDAQGGRSIEVFREYNPNAKAAGAHNYTINEIENSVLTSIGWLDEGIAWWAIK